MLPPKSKTTSPPSPSPEERGQFASVDLSLAVPVLARGMQRQAAVISPPVAPSVAYPERGQFASVDLSLAVPVLTRGCSARRPSSRNLWRPPWHTPSPRERGQGVRWFPVPRPTGAWVTRRHGTPPSSTNTCPVM